MTEKAVALPTEQEATDAYLTWMPSERSAVCSSHGLVSYAEFANDRYRQNMRRQISAMRVRHF
jgi:hypothetical protein